MGLIKKKIEKLLKKRKGKSKKKKDKKLGGKCAKYENIIICDGH